MLHEWNKAAAGQKIGLLQLLFFGLFMIAFPSNDFMCAVKLLC